MHFDTKGTNEQKGENARHHVLFALICMHVRIWWCLQNAWFLFV
jgi:hypothetical protein